MIKREIAFRDLKEEQSLTIQKFTEDLAEDWDNFVWDSNNGTMFHTRRFLNYHPQGRFQDCSLIFKRRQRWLAVLPAAVIHVDGKKILSSHAGASFAGPVFKSDLSFLNTFRLVEALVEFAKGEAFTQIVLTLPPQIYHLRPSNYLDFALLESGFTYLKREVSSVIPLDFAEEDTLMIFSPESRRAVRKAQKLAVQGTESEDFETFYAILKKNLKLRHNVQPVHSLDELLLLRNIFPDRIKLFAATIAGQMIAGIVVFVCNEKVALAFYVSHNEQMQKYRGVNYLFYHVIRWAIRHRLQFLDFGIFTVNMKPNWGLARFKESFGAQGIFRETLVRNL
ncbi:MAG: GNAT family N-acetyltransferase [bacterium]